MRAVSDGQRGNPVILPAATFEALKALEGDIGARPVIESAGLAVIDVKLVRLLVLMFDTPRLLSLQVASARLNMDNAAIEDMFEAVGPVTIRRMFGGKGIYGRGIIFALELRGELMLKATRRVTIAPKRPAPFAGVTRGKAANPSPCPTGQSPMRRSMIPTDGKMGAYRARRSNPGHRARGRSAQIGENRLREDGKRLREVIEIEPTNF